jgi:uncharacterized pyridoxamine 5'-phosphate oxidase family protein
VTPGETVVAADDRRVRAALRRAMIARIATVTAGGWPLVMPLYFVVIDGRIYMNNAATSPTVKNIERVPRALLVLQLREGEVIRVRGEACYRRDDEINRRVTRASLFKYVLRPRALLFMLRNLGRLEMRGRYVGERGDTGMIEVTPGSYSVAPH